MTPDEFSQLLKDGNQKALKETAAALLGLAFKTQNLAVRNFTKNDLDENKDGTGYIWKQTANSGYRVGPRRITGHLSRSLMAKLGRENDGTLRAFITAGVKEPVPYAASLEYGDPDRNILPRMYIGRAVEVIQETAKDDLLKALDIALRSGR